MNSPNDKKRKLLVFSPFAIITLGYLTARLTGAFLGLWAWLALALVLWWSQGLCNPKA